jgi:hypothetical protein
MNSPQTSVPISKYFPSPGAHLCSLWTDPATDRLAAAAFLRNARTDEQALCIFEMSRETESETRSAVAALSQGHASVFFTDDVHVAGGYFDPDRMRAFWVTQAHKASHSGARHLRAVAEMAWALRGCPGTGEAPVFESSLNRVLLPLPISVICQYGSTRFAPDLLLAMVLSHPLVVIGEDVFFNPFSVSHDRFPAHYQALKHDPAAALVPVWAYFLSTLPSLGTIGTFLCNSLPTLVAADRVLVTLQGLSSPVQLAVRDDRVDWSDGALARQAAAASTRLALRAEGPWGHVRSGRGEGMAMMIASFADDAGRVIVTRDETYSQRDELQFVMLTWHTAQAMSALRFESPETSDRPASGGGGA